MLMKTKYKKMSVITFSLTSFMALSQSPPQGNPPSNNTNARAAAAWYRGGNSLVGNANNIFGTATGFNSPIYTVTNGTTRTVLAGGGTGNNAGRMALGNNLVGSFVPANRLHLHQTGGAFGIQFTNNATGTTASNGFEMNLLNGGDFRFYQHQNQDVYFNMPSATLVHMRWNRGPFNWGQIEFGPATNPPLVTFAGSMYSPALANFGGAIAFSPSTNGNVSNTLMYHNTSISGNTTSLVHDGFRMQYDFMSQGAYNGDCLVFEKTDGQTIEPDGCIKFTNYGTDNVQKLSMVVEGNGHVGVGRPYTYFVMPWRRLSVQDTAVQFRITYTPTTNAATEVYTDFFTDPTGNMLIDPRNASNSAAGTVKINYGTNLVQPYPNLSLDVNGQMNVRTVNLDNSLTKVLVWDNVTGNVRYADASVIGGGGTGGGAVTADNGLTIFPSGSSNVELGGTLIKNTTIDQNNFDMSYTNTGRFFIGGTGNAKLTVKNDPGLGHIAYFNSANGTNRFLVADNGTVQITPDLTGSNLYGNYGLIVKSDFNATWGTNVDVITKALAGTTGGPGGLIGINSSMQGDVTNGQSIAFNATSNNTQGDNVGYDANIIQSTTGNNYGIHVWVENGQTAYGIYAHAGNATSNNFAGYFDGLVHVNGNIEANGFIPNPSDIQFKTDTAAIQANAADSLLSLLQPKSFYYDTTNTYGMNFSSKKQFGLIAQEVETILPNLVGQATKTAVIDTAGNVVSQAITYKTLTYTELIPLLIAGHKAQDAKMNALTSSNASLQNQNDSLENVVSDLNNRLSQLEGCLGNLLPLLCQINQSALNQNSQETQRQLSQVINVTLSNDENIVLNQNVPNPFAESTVITYSIPASVQQAQLLFYDGFGKLMKTVDINERGAGRVNVFGSDLSSGRYSYSLVADGKIVATKFMVKAQN